MNTTRIQIDFSKTVQRLPVAVSLKPACGGPRPNVLPLQIPPKADLAKESALSNHRLVQTLAASPLFQEFQRAFEDATGLPLTLRAVEGWQLAHSGSRRQNGFCALMSQANRSCSACLQAQQRICNGVNGVPCTLSCAFGINESAVGVKIGQEIIAYLQTGQVFFKPPTPQRTRAALQQLKQWGLDLDPNEAARTYNETRVMPQGEYQATIRLLQFFADQLGALANQIVLQQKQAEPAQIARGRQYIEDNYQEDFSLADVARHAGMCPSYFCKRFKKVTGVHFTHYVSRFRVEKAKALLLNPNYRISEIAFEVGFQSLTHFNRVFKHIAGQSPTSYREQLVAA